MLYYINNKHELSTKCETLINKYTWDVIPKAGLLSINDDYDWKKETLALNNDMLKHYHPLNFVYKFCKKVPACIKHADGSCFYDKHIIPLIEQIKVMLLILKSGETNKEVKYMIKYCILPFAW